MSYQGKCTMGFFKEKWNKKVQDCIFQHLWRSHWTGKKLYDKTESNISFCNLKERINYLEDENKTEEKKLKRNKPLDIALKGRFSYSSTITLSKTRFGLFVITVKAVVVGFPTVGSTVLQKIDLNKESGGKNNLRAYNKLLTLLKII